MLGFIESMKVLFIKLSAFGDLIHCLPALDDVLARDDVQEVHWLVDERFAFVTDVFPESVVIHRVALKGEHPIAAAWKVIQELRHEHFDVVIDLQSLIKSSLLAAATGAKVYGFDAREVREKPATWLQKRTYFHADERHVVQKYRHVAAMPWQPSSYAENPLAYQTPWIQHELKHTSFPTFPDKPWVVLSLGGSWQTKELPNDTWQAVAEGIAEKGWHGVMCWGNDEEHAKAKDIAEHVPLSVLKERLDIASLCSLLKQAKALVATDTGVLHLAAALGTPTVSFWGASASWRSGPLGHKHQFVESSPICGPCFKRQCANFVCMDMICADEILRCLKDMD
ncbi:MAG: lipopolysaccharide heptosyltransferase I [Mariprofundaceae bacterium]|nr:lipopolysaccharide heptosyltransferase I [Mariprofundaceae bacterium]